jgi:hypothetical protein
MGVAGADSTTVSAAANDVFIISTATPTNTTTYFQLDISYLQNNHIDLAGARRVINDLHSIDRQQCLDGILDKADVVPASNKTISDCFIR